MEASACKNKQEAGSTILAKYGVYNISRSRIVITVLGRYPVF